MVRAGDVGEKGRTLLGMKKEIQFQSLGSVKIGGFWKGSQ